MDNKANMFTEPLNDEWRNMDRHLADIDRLGESGPNDSEYDKTLMEVLFLLVAAEIRYRRLVKGNNA